MRELQYSQRPMTKPWGHLHLIQPPYPYKNFHHKNTRLRVIYKYNTVLWLESLYLERWSLYWGGALALTISLLFVYSRTAALHHIDVCISQVSGILSFSFPQLFKVVTRLSCLFTYVQITHGVFMDVRSWSLLCNILLGSVWKIAWILPKHLCFMSIVYQRAWNIFILSQSHH